eukprot:GEMP01086910.1.p1 GENE.GEMP01086910.1~~GEMP01086910.1.p1  ORF type:complete len:168 (-),score=51.58 GEMP01086910.1:238-741(-)
MSLLSKIIAAAADIDAKASSAAQPTACAKTQGARKTQGGHNAEGARKTQGALNAQGAHKTKRPADKHRRAKGQYWIKVDDKWEQTAVDSRDAWGGMWRVVGGQKLWVQGRWAKSGKYWEFTSTTHARAEPSSPTKYTAPELLASRISLPPVDGSTPPVLPVLVPMDM